MAEEEDGVLRKVNVCDYGWFIYNFVLLCNSIICQLSLVQNVFGVLHHNWSWVGG